MVRERLTGRTLYHADCSAVEAAHSLLRQSEEAHKTKTVHDHGSDNHLKRFKSSIVIFSSKNFGPDNTSDGDIEFHKLVTEETGGGVEQVDMSQFVTDEPLILMRMQGEVARLKRGKDQRAGGENQDTESKSQEIRGCRVQSPIL